MTMPHGNSLRSDVAQAYRLGVSGPRWKESFRNALSRIQEPTPPAHSRPLIEVFTCPEQGPLPEFQDDAERLAAIGLWRYSESRRARYTQEEAQQDIFCRLTALRNMGYEPVSLALATLHRAMLVFRPGLAAPWTDAGTIRCVACVSSHRFIAEIPDFALARIEKAQQALPGVTRFDILSTDPAYFETIRRVDPIVVAYCPTLVDTRLPGSVPIPLFICCWDMDREVELAELLKQNNQ